MPEDQGNSLKFTELGQTQDETKNDLRHMVKRLEILSVLVAAAGVVVIALGIANEQSGHVAAITGFVMIFIGLLAYFLSPLLIGLLCARSASEVGALLGRFGQAWSMFPASIQSRLIGLGLGIFVVVIALINLQLGLDWLNKLATIMAFVAALLFLFPTIGAVFIPKRRTVVLPMTGGQASTEDELSMQLVVGSSLSASRGKRLRGIASIVMMFLVLYGVGTGIPLITGLALILAVAFGIERLQALVTWLFPNGGKLGSGWSIRHTLLLVLFLGSLAIVSVGAVTESGFLTVGGTVLLFSTPLIALGAWLISKLRVHSISGD